MLQYMYITNDLRVAEIADYAGVNRIFVDLETIGKATRQKGLNSVQSQHTPNDVKCLKPVLKHSELLVRINPVNKGTTEEINTVIQNGADILMLPYFKSYNEVIFFLNCVRGRTKTMLLIETPEAVDHLDEILSIPGIDECHIGLNDLHLGYGRKFMFELLADGTVDRIVEKIKMYSIPFGIGGVARIGSGMLPAEKILAEHIRLQSQMAILSRSFCNTTGNNNYDAIERCFMTELPKLRAAEMHLLTKSPVYLQQNHLDVIHIVQKITESIL